MKKTIFIMIAAALIQAFLGSAASQSLVMPPEGDAGIAAKYPGDLGIGNDPDVIRAEGFESYNSASESDLGRTWRVINEQHMSITTDSKNVVTGAKALQMSLPAQYNVELYNGIDLYLTEEQKQDVMYIRYYQKIDESYAIDRTTSNHNGGSISSRYWTCGADAGSGIASNGTNKFLADFQSTQSTQFDGHSMMIYTYHPDMRYNDPTPSPFDKEIRPSTPRGQQYADHLYPDGDVMPWDYRKGNYGEDFVPRPKFNIELGRWYCYELMLKANTPGLRDGRLTAWIDGEIIMDFGNMRFRDINDLKIDLVGFSFGCASNPVATKAWFDNIVIAKSYIGPIYSGSPNANNAEAAVAAKTLKAYVQNGILHVSGLVAGETWNVYDIAGILVHQSIAGGDVETWRAASLQSRGVYIVKSGNQTAKALY